MSLINCLSKIKAFDTDERKYLLSKSKELQSKGMSAKEADAKVVEDLQKDLTSTLKSIYEQVEGVSFTKIRKISTPSTFDGKLKPQRIVYRNKQIVLEEEEYSALSKEEKAGYEEEMAPAQILIPWTYKGQNGKTLNIKKYIDENGFLDLKKFDPALLKRFGLRIPNQGHNSMSYMEVVGFLPEVMGDVVIAPRNLIVQMGSDFDVDKLYTYHYKPFRRKGGRLIRKKKDTKNELLDVHLSVVSNPNIFDSVVTPLGLGKLYYKEGGKTKGIAVDVKNYYKNKNTANSYLSINRDSDNYLESADGKTMISIIALTSTFSSLLYQTKEQIQPIKVITDPDTKEKVEIVLPFTIGIDTKDGKVKSKKLDSISLMVTVNGTRKLYTISAFISAAVDNDKNPILSFMNIVPETSEVLTYLLHMGINEEWIGAFLGQPAIKELVFKKKIQKGSVKEGEFKNATTIQSELVDKYLKLSIKELGLEKLDKKEIAELKNELEDFPLSYNQLRNVFLEKANTPVRFKGQLYTLTPNQIQLITLLKAQSIEGKGKFLSDMQRNLNIESQGVGITLLGVADKYNKVDKFRDNQQFSNITALIEDTSIAGQPIKYGLNPAHTMLNANSLFPFTNLRVMEMFKRFEDILPTDANKDKVIQLAEQEEIWRDMKSFIFSDPAMYGLTESIEDLREEIFFDRKGNKSLATLVHELSKNPIYANNSFLSKLTTHIDRKGVSPSFVHYIATKAETVDINTTYQGLLELLNTKQTAHIGKKLIYYFYLNGGNQRAKEWGKLIDPLYLDKIGISKVLKEANFGDIAFARDFREQWAQHKPSKLPKLVVDEDTRPYIQIVEGKSIESAMSLKLPPSSSGLASERFRKILGGKGYYPYIVIRNKWARKGYSLFKYSHRDTDGKDVFVKIPVLGSKFFNEYQYIKGDEVNDDMAKTSLLAKKFKTPKKVKDTTVEKVFPKNDIKDIPNVAKPYGAVKLMDDTIGKVLIRISEGTKNNNHKLLADLLATIANVQDLKIVHDPNLETAGAYRNKTVFINPLHFEDGAINTYEKYIIHEVIHAALDGILGDNGTATPAQRAAWESIKTIFKTIRDGVLAGEYEDIGLFGKDLIEFDTLYSKAREDGYDSLTDNEKDRLSYLRDTYYPLSQLTIGDQYRNEYSEYVTGLLTSPEFQTILNKIKYDGNKTFLDRVIDLITKILAEFNIQINGKTLTVDQESALAESLKRTLAIFNKGDGDSTTKPTLGPKSLVDSNQIDMFNENHAIASKSIEDDANLKFTEIINAFRTRAIVLQQSIQKAYLAEDRVRAKELEERKKEIERATEDLINKNILATVFAHGHNDIERAKAVLDQDFVSINDILYVKGVALTWGNAVDHLISEEEQRDKTANYLEAVKLRDEASKIYDDYEILARERLLEMVKETSGMDNLTNSILDQHESIGVLTAELLDISRSGNTLLSVVSLWMRKANYNTNLEVQQIRKDLQNLTKNWKESSSWEAYGGYDALAQVDENGAKTGNLVMPLSPKYFVERDKLIRYAREEKNKKKRDRKWKRYFDWIRENHIILDNRKLFKADDDGKYTYSPDTAYLQELLGKFKTQEEVDRHLDILKERIDHYNVEIQAKIDSVAGNPDAVRILDEWIVENDPNIYSQNLIDGYVERKVNGKIISSRGYRFTVKRATEAWEDPKYTTIKNNPEMYEYYKYARETLQRLYGYLPLGYKEDITTNTIPSISKSLIEEYTDGGFLQAWDGMKKALVRETTTAASAGDEGLKEEGTGRALRQLSVKGLTLMSPEDKSYDLTKVLQAFALEAAAFKHKSRTEDALKLAESILLDAVELQRGADGYYKKDRFKELTTRNLTHVQNQFLYALDAFFGKRKVVQGTIGGFTVVAPADKDKVAYLDAYMVALQNGEPFSLEIPEELKPAIKRITKLKKKEDRLEALQKVKNEYVRNVTGSQVGDLILQYVQVKGMGWNPFSALTNWLVGLFSNINWASGGSDFDLNNLWRATGVILSGYYNTSVGKKIDSLMVRFDALKEINEAAYESTTNTNIARKGIKKLAPLEMQRQSERFVQGQTLVAMLMAKKVITANGDEVSLWEAFNEDGNWNEELHGPAPEWTFNPNAQDKIEGNAAFDFKVALDQVLKSIHGNYDTTGSPVRIKKGILGRAAMQFRSWIAEGFLQRVGKEDYDMLLKRNVKGRYRTYTDLGFTKSIKTMLQLAVGKGDKAFENLKDSKGIYIQGDALRLTKENMRKNLAEAVQLLSLYAIAMILDAIAFEDDDDDEEKFIRNYAINTTLRMLDDTMFYFNPNSFENITRAAIPASSLIGDVFRWGDALGEAIIGEDTIPTGVKAKQSRILWKTAKLFPFTQAFAANINKGTQEENFRR